MDYIVVFEYTTKAGGNTGTRFTIKYKDHAEFKNTTLVLGTGVIAKSVSEKMASNLISFTPEICRITTAIEKSCNTDGTVDTNIIDRNLYLAVSEIKYDRHYITDNQLDPFSSDFEKCVVDPEPTEKNRLLQKALSLCTSQYGHVDTGAIVWAIKNEVEAIMATRLLTHF
ncbi:hypothetical protein D4S03_10970 [bacterium]|nr:MAG: hypothetical protein D4S03_10970 [bacterium]